MAPVLIQDPLAEEVMEGVEQDVNADEDGDVEMDDA